LLTLIACLAGVTQAQQAQSAHFSKAVQPPSRTSVQANRNSLAADLTAAPQISTTHGDFGSVNVGATSASPVSMVFTFDAAVTLGSTTVLTQGATGLDFTDAGGGTCTPNKAYNASDTCSINVTFMP